MLRRVAQGTLVGVLLLVMASLAAAQQTPQPVVRLGNFIEVGNDLFMHILATADIRYKTSHNADFEDRIRDRALSRNPSSTSQHAQEGDLTYAELRFGADFRYQKSLTFQLMFEHQSIFDGNLTDDRANTTNPGGTDVFGRAASTENPGFRVERYWMRYKFPGTPARPFRPRRGARQHPSPSHRKEVESDCATVIDIQAEKFLVLLQMPPGQDMSALSSLPAACPECLWNRSSNALRGCWRALAGCLCTVLRHG